MEILHRVSQASIVVHGVRPARRDARSIKVGNLLNVSVLTPLGCVWECSQTPWA